MISNEATKARQFGLISFLETRIDHHFNKQVLCTTIQYHMTLPVERNGGVKAFSI